MAIARRRAPDFIMLPLPGAFFILTAIGSPDLVRRTERGRRETDERHKA